MINCPYCNELIGEGLESCPICLKEFTAQYRRSMLEKQMKDDRVKQEDDRNIKYKHHRKTMIFKNIMNIILVLNIINMLIIIKTHSRLCIHTQVVLFVIFIVTRVIGITFFKVLSCPYCDMYLRSIHIVKCPHCGAEVK